MATWLTCSAGTVGENITKIDARLHAMMQSLNFHERTMARMGEIGITTVQSLHTLVDDRASLRGFIKSALGIDPAIGFEHSLEAGKIVAAWEQSAIRIVVENKRDAERVASGLPPQLTGEELALLKAKFEKAFNRNKPITKAQVPSKPYLELKTLHAETMWTAERLTEVTSLAQAERHAVSNSSQKSWTMDDGDTVSFKIVTKPFGIPAPADSEALRARLELMANTFLFLKLKFPQKGVLATCSRSMWDHYIRYLFGDEVWGFSIKDGNRRPVACPHQGIVEDYDLAIRDKVALLMSEGTDIEAAFDLAMEDKDLKNTAFLCAFTTEKDTPRCKALSAPAFKDIHGAGSASGSKRQLSLENGDVEKPLTKKQKKAAAKRKERDDPPPQPHNENRQGKKAKGNGRQQLALGNGGVGDGGKGGGKQKLKIKTTADQKPICFAFNNGQACKQSPCNFAHVCQLCEGPHPKTDAACPLKGK